MLISKGYWDVIETMIWYNFSHIFQFFTLRDGFFTVFSHISRVNGCRTTQLIDANYVPSELKICTTCTQRATFAPCLHLKIFPFVFKFSAGKYTSDGRLKNWLSDHCVAVVFRVPFIIRSDRHA